MEKLRAAVEACKQDLYQEAFAGEIADIADGYRERNARTDARPVSLYSYIATYIETRISNPENSKSVIKLYNAFIENGGSLADFPIAIGNIKRFVYTKVEQEVNMKITINNIDWKSDKKQS